MINARRRRILYISLGLGLVLSSAAVLAGRRLGWWLIPDVRVGSGRAYAILGDIPVKHRNRVKPLQSLAIAEIQRIHGRPAITLPVPDGKSTTTWEPVAAILDWSARPEFWDEQEFILVEDRALRQLIVEASIREELHSLAGKESAKSREFLHSLGSQPKLAEEDLRAAAERAGEMSSAGKSLSRMAARMGARHSWLSPRLLATTRFPYEGRDRTLPEWVGHIEDARERAGRVDAPGLNPFEEAALQAGERYSTYRSIRDHNFTDAKPQDLLMFPRPNEFPYLLYSTEVYQKGMKPDQNLAPIETDAVNTLLDYLETLPGRKWALPGEDGMFDQEYELWLVNDSPWIPVGVFLRSDEASLSKAGMPSKLIAEFRKNYRAVEDAERATPGEIPEALAIALVGSIHALSTNLQEFPDAASIADKMARESRYNRVDPFSKSAIAYGLSLVLLVLNLANGADRRTIRGKLGIAFRLLSRVGILAGIALGVNGVYLRFQILGTFPVANMYETTVFVALALAALGLAAEILWQRKYAAAVATVIALAATLLAQNPRLLDPNVVVSLPVERYNRWLVIHVVPILSGYATFALAMGLGLVALGYVLTATYRRAASYRELAWPVLPGIPLYIVGRFLMDTASLDRPWFGDVGLGLAVLGGALSIVGGVSALGELANRSPRTAIVHGLLVATLGTTGLIAGTSDALPLSLATAFGVPDAWLVPSLGCVLMMMGLLAHFSGEGLDRIQSIARFNFQVILLGLLMFGVGTITGIAWARSIWGESWMTEPKVLWTLITFGVYLVPPLGRMTGWMKPFGIVAASVVCFAFVLVSWCGVNSSISPGRHRFVMTHGEGRNFAFSTTTILLSVLGASVWRRSRSQLDATLV